MLNLTMMKRNYFDSEAAIDIPVSLHSCKYRHVNIRCIIFIVFLFLQQHKLSIWPGYLTTIHLHNNDYLLGVEIVHKVLRQDSALNVMERIRRESRTGDFWVIDI